MDVEIGLIPFWYRPSLWTGFRISTVRKPKTAKERFYASVIPLADGCWLWVGGQGDDGYGKFWNGSAHEGVYRFALRVLRGVDVRGRDVDHLCRRPSCANPDHLEAVTHRVNLLRGISPAAINARKTHCKHGHEFSPENTMLDNQGKRRCRRCDYERNKRSRRRRGQKERVHPITEGQRACTRCGLTKPLSSFYNKSRGPGGKTSRCIDCISGRQRVGGLRST